MMGDWTFFSNYGHVLVCLARNNQARLRDVALEVGITERAVQKIVRDLQDAGYLIVTKQGRCNRYRINKRKSLRHSLESHCNVGKLLALVVKAPKETPAAPLQNEEVARSVEPEPAKPEILEASKPEPVSKPQAPVVKKKTAKKEKAKNSGPVDVRQQGSLF